MTSNDGSNTQEMTFFKNLLNRRVPYIIGIYLGVSWGIIQFIDWIVNRYLLSPHFVDLAFVIFLTLMPSIILLAYFHGLPGRNRWRALEKITIPVNILILVLLVTFVFNSKDFGRMSQKVKLKDETGKTIERVIPKAEYKKNIALFYFDNTSGDTSLDWLQYGTIYMLKYDLDQDLFIDVLSPDIEGITPGDYYVLDKIKEAGYKKAVGLPLLLKRKISSELHMDYFLSGKFSKEKDDLIFEISLYRSQNAKRLANTSFRGKGRDIFQRVDDMTVWIKKELGIPSGHIEAVNDLPLAEIFTRSLPAARSFTLAGTMTMFKNDWSTAQKYYKTSLEEDPTFTWARIQLARVYMVTNQAGKVRDLFQTIMQQLFKLPERLQFYVKSGYYNLKQDQEKQIAVLRMIIKLYPQDIKAYAGLALILKWKGEYDEAIDLYKRILTIDSRCYNVLQAIGEIYEKKGDLQQALTFYQKYAEHFPKDPESFIPIGHLYEKMGDFPQAKSQYEKALLFKPDDIPVLINLANIEATIGHFENAHQQYQEALKLSKIPKDKAAAYDGLVNLCTTRGQMKKSLEYFQRQLTFIKEYMAPYLVSIVVAVSVSNYIKAGEEQEAFRTLGALKQELKPPLDTFIDFGYIMIYLELERADEAEKLLPVIEKFNQTIGVNILTKFVYLAKGRIQQIRKQYTKAIESFQKGLEYEPSYGELLRRIGQCHRQLKQYEKAEKVLLNSLKYRPYNPKLNYDLALLYLDMGNKEKALKHVKVALEVWKDADVEYKPGQLAMKTLERLQQN
jgi:tetratricopeptide (TPR) repeat protein